MALNYLLGWGRFYNSDPAIFTGQFYSPPNAREEVLCCFDIEDALTHGHGLSKSTSTTHKVHIWTLIFYSATTILIPSPE